MRVLQGEDNHDRWMTFAECWADYCLLEQVYAKTPAHQLAMFRVAFGEANRELLRHLGAGQLMQGDVTDPNKDKPCKSLTAVFAKLTARFQKHENKIHRRYVFHKATQSAGETVSDFFDRLLKLAKTCGYATYEDTMVRDQLVVGTSLASAREEIFKGNGVLSLDEVLATLRRFEDNQKALEDIGNGDSSRNDDVHLVRNKKIRR